MVVAWDHSFRHRAHFLPERQQGIEASYLCQGHMAGPERCCVLDLQLVLQWDQQNSGPAAALVSCQCTGGLSHPAQRKQHRGIFPVRYSENPSYPGWGILLRSRWPDPLDFGVVNPYTGSPYIDNAKSSSSLPPFLLLSPSTHFLHSPPSRLNISFNMYLLNTLCPVAVLWPVASHVPSCTEYC